MHPQPPICTPKVVGKADVISACRLISQEFSIKDLGGGGADEEGERWDPNEAWEEKKMFLEKFDLIPDDILVRIEDPLSDEVCTAACIMMLSKQGFEEVFASDDDATLMEPKIILSEEYLGTLISLSLLKLCDEQLKEYDTSAKDDAELLANSSIPDRLRCAVTVRLEEKRALQMLKKTLAKKMLEEEDGLEQEQGELAGGKRLKTS